MSNLPKGFYTGPDGKERFWDGEEWFISGKGGDLVGPGKSNGKSSPNGRAYRRPLLLLAAIVLIGVVSVASWAVLSPQTADQASTQEDDLVMDEQEREEVIAQNQAIADQNAVAYREQAVEQLEEDVKKLAKEQANARIIRGPVLSVKCTPTGGYSLGALEIRSMPFECFVATEDLGGGTFRGVDYHALANWDDWTITFGLGKK